MTAFTATAAANCLLLNLTPAEKWQAIRRLGSNFAGEPTFVLVCMTALLTLTVSLIVASYSQRQKNLRAANELFTAYADQRGLSLRERQILLEIATKAKLKRNESIFTLVKAFNRGAARVTDEALTSHGARGIRRLGAELAAVREKLGFERRASDSSGSAIKSSKHGSRQIPVGKKIQIKPHAKRGPDSIEATVIKNDQVELAVKLTTPLEAEPGDLCCVHYYFGSSIWEFDASVLSCHGGILILTHSYDVRFINRRRFLRVPVNKPALIASFPFARTFPTNGDNTEGAEHGSTETSPVCWGPPEFIPAEVTELAGPGLRIEAPLEVEAGDRVVVILKMREETSSLGQRSWSGSNGEQRGERSSSRVVVVEDVGEVRHIEATENGFSMGVELTGLSDSNVNELVRETNLASLAAGAGKQDVPAEGDGPSNVAELAGQVAV
ncbi:MAG: hypothetical protein JSW59_15855 [Phycisphaerales bacterium]|nr:MAG: hypothetical protein JSW59_15855 [Phycisphaerales bacterium]